MDLKTQKVERETKLRDYYGSTGTNVDGLDQSGSGECRDLRNKFE